MRAKVFLRVAAILILVHLLGHGFGHFKWDQPDDPKMAEVVKVMKSYSADFMGSNKSMADYYQGYSLILFGLFGMSLFIILKMLAHTQSHPELVRGVLYPLGFSYLYFGVVEYLYFFQFAAGISFLSGIAMMLAIATLSSKN